MGWFDYQPDEFKDYTYGITFRANRKESSEGRANLAPRKTVYTETLVWSGSQLIAAVGGTLGLTFGFSFAGALDWIFPKLG